MVYLAYKIGIFSRRESVVSVRDVMRDSIVA